MIATAPARAGDRSNAFIPQTEPASGPGLQCVVGAGGAGALRVRRSASSQSRCSTRVRPCACASAAAAASSTFDTDSDVAMPCAFRDAAMCRSIAISIAALGVFATGSPRSTKVHSPWWKVPPASTRSSRLLSCAWTCTAGAAPSWRRGALRRRASRRDLDEMDIGRRCSQDWRDSIPDGGLPPVPVSRLPAAACMRKAAEKRGSAVCPTGLKRAGLPYGQATRPGPRDRSVRARSDAASPVLDESDRAGAQMHEAGRMRYPAGLVRSGWNPLRVTAERASAQSAGGVKRACSVTFEYARTPLSLM